MTSRTSWNRRRFSSPTKKSGAIPYHCPSRVAVVVSQRRGGKWSKPADWPSTRYYYYHHHPIETCAMVDFASFVPYSTRAISVRHPVSSIVDDRDTVPPLRSNSCAPASRDAPTRVRHRDDEDSHPTRTPDPHQCPPRAIVHRTCTLRHDKDSCGRVRRGSRDGAGTVCETRRYPPGHCVDPPPRFRVVLDARRD